MKTFTLRISSIRRDFYTGPCESLVFTTLDGMVGILADHVPTVYAVSAGELRFTVNGETKELAVGDGMARVADQVIFMDGGVVVEQGDSREIINHPKEERTKQFLSRFTEQ